MRFEQGHETRDGPGIEPAPQGCREQHGARGHTYRRLHEIQCGVEGRDLVEDRLEDREHEEYPDREPATQKVEGSRKLEEPEGREEPHQGERQVGPDSRDGGEPDTEPDDKERFHGHDYSAPLRGNFANIAELQSISSGSEDSCLRA